MAGLAFVLCGCDNAITSGTPGVTTQDFTTIETSRTPVAALFTVTSAVSDAGGLADHLRVSVGVADGTYQGGYSKSSENNVATSVCRHVGFNNGVIKLLSGDGSSVVAHGSFDSFISGGVRIVWDTIPDGSYEVKVEMWFGEDCEAKAGLAIPDPDTDPALEIPCGFKPQHIMSICAAGARTNSTIQTTAADLGLGHHVADPGDDSIFSRVVTWQEKQAAAVGNTSCELQDYHAILRGGVLPFLYVQAFTYLTEVYDNGGGDAGFKILSASGDGGTGPRFVYLAIRYGDGHGVFLDTDATPTASPDTVSFTPGWPGGAAWILATGVDGVWPGGASVTGPASTQACGFVGLDEEQSGMMWGQEDGSDPIVAVSAFLATRSYSLLAEDLSTPAVMGIATLANDGVDVEFDTIDSTARQFAILIIEKPEFNATGAGTFPLPTGAGVGEQRFAGEGPGLFPLPHGTGAGELVFEATSAGTFPLPTGTGSGESTFEATGAGTFPLATGAGTAELVFEATGAGTFPLATGTATGSIAHTGVGAGSFPVPTGTGSGEQVFTATSAGVFPLPSGAGTAELVFESSGAAILPLPTGTGAGILCFESTGAGIFPLPTATGAGIHLEEFEGDGAGTFPLPTGLGTGVLCFEATGAGTFPLPIGTGFGQSGDLLACISSLLGSYVVLSPLLGSSTSASGLSGNSVVISELMGRSDLSTDLRGSYNTHTSLEGGIC